MNRNNNDCLEVVKAWGKELWLVNKEGPNGYCCKKLYVNAGHICSLHCHHKKNESFIVLGGNGYIELQSGLPHPAPIFVKKGDIVDVAAGVYHRFWSYEGLTMLEVSSHHDDADVCRIAESGKLGSPDRRLSPHNSL